VRPLTRGEVQALFDHADGKVARARQLGNKGWVAAFRDATLFKTIYAFGLRRREAAMLDLADFTRNAKAPEFGRFGACHVRYGKAMRGSPPRRRTVLNRDALVGRGARRVRRQRAPSAVARSTAVAGLAHQMA
jgi:integrase/recombinase XerC